MLAPFVYYIRFLPTILICVLLSYYGFKNKNLTSSITGKSSFIILLAVTTFYNFEYSILTGLAIFFSIYEKKLFYFITSADL